MADSPQMGATSAVPQLQTCNYGTTDLRTWHGWVVNLVANGMTTTQIVAEYPDLEAEDVAQALKYAARVASR
jgi:hypothetical protein